MRNLQLQTGSPALLCSAVTALALPPPSFAFVPDSWSGKGTVVPELEIAIWADAAVDLTGATLYGAQLRPLSFTAIAVTPDHTTGKLGATAHGLFTGDGPLLLTSTVAFPTGTDGATEYYAIKIDANNIELALSLDGALAGTAIAFTSNGSGTIKLNSQASTERVHWHSMGLLGLAGDGAIDLDAQSSYWDVRKHSPMTIAYAVVATFASGSGKVTAGIVPRVDRD
jgi:hypothetical protein